MSYDEYREEKSRTAQEYQDFVTDKLLRYGIVLNQYSSRKYQYEVGESASGIEVKHDELLHETGNLFIEVAEKARPERASFTPSGIYRDDGSWLYLIGDESRALLFSKKQLRHLVESEGFNYRLITSKKGTSQGYAIEYKKLEESTYCLKSFVFKQPGRRH